MISLRKKSVYVFMVFLLLAVVSGICYGSIVNAAALPIASKAMMHSTDNMPASHHENTAKGNTLMPCCSDQADMVLTNITEPLKEDKINLDSIAISAADEISLNSLSSGNGILSSTDPPPLLDNFLASVIKKE